MFVGRQQGETCLKACILQQAQYSCLSAILLLFIFLLSYRPEGSSKDAFRHKTLKSAAKPRHWLPARQSTFKMRPKMPIPYTHSANQWASFPFKDYTHTQKKIIKQNRLNLFRQIQSQNRLTFPSSRAEKKQTVMQAEQKQTQPK